jgi:hypothetical protein
MQMREVITIKSFFLFSCFLFGILFGILDEDKKDAPIAKNSTILMLTEEFLDSKEEIKGLRIPIENDRGGYSIIKAEELIHRYCNSMKIKGVSVEEYSANSNIPYSSMSSDFGMIKFDGVTVISSRFWGNLKYKNKDAPEILTKVIDKEKYVKNRRSHSIRSRQASISISEK